MCAFSSCYYTLFTERGGQGPPFIFQRGGLFEKRGGQIFFVHPLPQKLILHHIDTFIMQVSWRGSKHSNEIIIFKSWNWTEGSSHGQKMLERYVELAVQNVSWVKLEHAARRRRRILKVLVA